MYQKKKEYVCIHIVTNGFLIPISRSDEKANDLDGGSRTKRR